MIHDTVKKFRSLFILGVFLSNFLHNPAIHAALSEGGTLQKVATCVAVCGLYAYRGAALSTPLVKGLGGEYDENGWSAALTDDHGFAFGGDTSSYGLGLHTKGVLGKYDAFTEQEWYLTFGGNSTVSDTTVRGIDVITGERYVMTGESTGYVGGMDKNMFITVYDAAGATWETAKVMGSSEQEGGVAVAVNADGSYVTAGYTWDMTTLYDVSVTKFYANHTEAWSQVFRGSGDDYPADIIPFLNGSLVVGYTESAGPGGKNVLLFYVDDLGTLVWSRVLGTHMDEEAFQVISTSDAKLWLVGYIQGIGAGEEDVLVIRCSSVGIPELALAIGGPGSDVGYTLFLADNSDLFIGGSTDSDGFGGRDGLVLQVGAQGTLEEAYTIGSSNHDVGYQIMVKGGGHNITLVGTTLGTEAGSRDILFAGFSFHSEDICRIAFFPEVLNITDMITWENISLSTSVAPFAMQEVVWDTTLVSLQETPSCLSTETPTIDPTLPPSRAPTTYEIPEVIQGIDPYNIEVGDDFHVKIVLKKFFKHANGYPMTLDLVEKGKNELPKGMAFNASTGVFSFKAGDSHIKSYTLYLSATDNRGGKDGFPFNVNVRDPLSDPGMQLADYFKVGAPFLVLLISVLIVPICTYFLCKRQEKEKKDDSTSNTSIEMAKQSSIHVDRPTNYHMDPTNMRNRQISHD